MKIKEKIIQYIKKKFLKKYKNIFIEKNVKFKSVNFEGYNKIGKNSIIDRTDIGIGSYVGEDCYLPNTKIGKFCSIASRVRLVLGNHPTHTFVTSHPFAYAEEAGICFKEKNFFNKFSYANEEKNYISIGNDVWIGENVSILNGIRINDGAIIATGAVVVKDVPEYAIMAGVPARILKYRFSKKEIEKLKEIEWWNKDLKWIEENNVYFSDIKEFIKRYDKIFGGGG